MAREGLATMGRCAAAAVLLSAGMGCSGPPCTVVPQVPRLVQLAPEQGQTFPYQYVDDYEAPRYTYFRAEGRGPNVVASGTLCGVDYVEKYAKKKLCASSAETAYFASQAKVVAALRADPAAIARAQSADSVKVGFVGDIMWIRNNWNAFLGDDVKRTMDRADFWLGNLETLVSKSTPVEDFFPDYANYNSAPGLVQSFRRASGEPYFKALSLANNHVLDFKDPAAIETLAFLDGEHILHNGLSQTVPSPSYTAFTVKGVKFGYYAATWGVNDMAALTASKLHVNVIGGFAPIGAARDVDITGIVQALAEMAKDAVDVKIVSMHWGNEFEMYPDPLEVLVARQIVGAGADVIVGSHPHVEQPIEVCWVNGPADAPCNVLAPSARPRKALVMYSLGDFTTAKYTLPCQQAPMKVIAVTRDPAGATTTWDFAWDALALNELDYGKPLTHHLGMTH